jgi:uncharacterized protein YyaL (SSP411 family)
MSLQTTTSSYLSAHKDSPVKWRTWGPEAQAEARAEGKPIFLSIGYASCHWCHALDKESFRDESIAALINDNYIPVIADREERPDLDMIYQGAAGAMRHQGGWPLNIFLTPDGVPFWVTGYLPRERKVDQVGMRDVLTTTAELWKTDQVKVAEISATVRASLENLYNRDMAAAQETMNLDLAALRIAQTYDIFFGGMQGAIKFPNTAMMQLLWNAFLRTGTPQFSQLIFTTVDSILFGGVYDHIGGGFFRHTQDERWLEPVMEKTLYDNALLIDFCTQIWQFNRNELCRQRVAESVAFLMRDLKLGGAFAAALGSGAEDIDSKYYTWSEAEIDAALVGTFSARFKQVYGITRDGNFRGRNLPRRLGNVAPANEADEVLLAKQRDMLLASRLKRTLPARDDRLVADWNGLAIIALARAGMAFDRADWISAAITAFDAVVKELGDGDRLAHSSVGGVKAQAGFADDYANMAKAAIQLWEVTSEERFITQAKAWVATLDVHFWNNQIGGYCYSADDAEPLFIRARMLFENPAPSANGTMLFVLTRLALITGDTQYMSRASTQAVTFGNEANRVLNGSGTFLTGFEYLANSLIILVIGHRGNGRTQDLVRAIWSKPLPNGLVVQIEPGDALPQGHPASGKGLVGGQPTAYICQLGNCSDGITDPAQLANVLTLPVQMRQQLQQRAS